MPPGGPRREEEPNAADRFDGCLEEPAATALRKKAFAGRPCPSRQGQQPGDALSRSETRPHGIARVFPSWKGAEAVYGKTSVDKEGLTCDVA